MDEIIKLVKTYRLTPALDQRQRLAEEIFREVEPQLRFFMFGTLTHPAAQDVLQETLKAVTVTLTKFKGDSPQEFWAWCYRIARNKVNDHLRKQAADRLQPMPPAYSGACRTPIPIDVGQGSDSYRTAFRLISDRVPIDVGQF